MIHVGQGFANIMFYIILSDFMVILIRMVSILNDNGQCPLDIRYRMKCHIENGQGPTNNFNFWLHTTCTD